MQVKISQKNDICYKGFRSDYTKKKLQYNEAVFKFNNCANQQTWTERCKARSSLDNFYHKNRFKTLPFILKEFISILLNRNDQKYYNNEQIKTLEAKLLTLRSNITINTGDESIPIQEFEYKFATEKNTHKREIMLNSFLKAHEALKNTMVDLVIKRNEFAQEKGFNNYYEYRLKEEFNINATEIDDLIHSFPKRKELISILDERKKILAKHWNISVNNLKPHHINSLISFFGFDNYIESPEQIVKLTKKTYQNMGFEIEEIEKQGRIFYDLYSQDRKNTFRNYCCFYPENNATGICVNTKPNVQSLKTILHEFGHAVYYLNTSNLLLDKNKPPKSVYTEAISIMFEKILYNENLLKDILPDEYIEEFKKIGNIEDSVSKAYFFCDTEFERELYKNPNQDIEKLASTLNQKYNLSSSSVWFFNHLITNPARRAVYLKASLLADEMYNVFTKALGGNLSNNPKTATLLKDSIFKYGRFMNDKRLHKNLNKLI